MDTARHVDDHFVSAYLTLERAMSSQRHAFRALAQGSAVGAPRVTLPGAAGAVVFFTVARVTPDGAAVTKFGSVNPHNAERDASTVSATLTVLDAETGRPAATIAGTALTTIRTAAASALATQELARPDARSLGIVGTGVQARAHALALARVCTLREIRIAGRSVHRVRELGEDLAATLGIRVVPASAEDAAAADIVVTCTTSREPVIEASWVRPGSTVISIGAFAPDHVELPPSLLERSDRLVLDHVETASAQSGSVRAWETEFGQAAAETAVSLGDVLTGRAAGRRSPEEIVVYVSVGLGVQDAAAALMLLGRGN